MELLKNQIERQDTVDNAIFALLQEINPTDNEIDWDINLIGNIRESIQECFVDELKICSEKEFYPFIEE